MMKSIIYYLLLCLVCMLPSCIKNDIPYPHISLSVERIYFRGQIGAAQIDNEKHTVTVQLSDTVLLQSVHLDSVFYSDPSLTSTLSPGTDLNLSDSYPFTLSLYQEYHWTLSAQQTIDYSFRVKGQVGESVIDAANHRAIVYVNKSVDLKNVTVEELKLGPSTSIIKPELSVLTDFSKKKTVVCMFKDEMVEWDLYVFHTDSNITTGTPYPWVNVAWLNGTGEADAVNGFEIKEADAEEWEKVDPTLIISDGGNFSARLTHLKPSTDYVYRAYSGDEYGDEVTFTTYAPMLIPNASFDYWTKEKAVWNPWREGETAFWDTGNKGAATLGESNTIPSDDTYDGGDGKSAQLCSRFVGIGSIGKFAGNIYMGNFVKVDGTNGILNFGRPYTSFPTRLKLHYKYKTVPIDYVSEEWATLKGQPDTCAIYIALGDWDEPVEIRTRPSNRKLFDKHDPHVIAYAEHYQGSTVNDWTPLELELEYRDKKRKPTYMLIVCSASKYGDYFTGGAGTTLWIDNLSLEFDY